MTSAARFAGWLLGATLLLSGALKSIDGTAPVLAAGAYHLATRELDLHASNAAGPQSGTIRPAVTTRSGSPSSGAVGRPASGRPLSMATAGTPGA